MDTYQTEEQQVEALKDWWKENSRSIIIGIVVGVSAIMGWKAWQGQIQTQAEQASNIYQQILVANDKKESAAVTKLSEQLIEGYADTAYAEYATLFLVKQAVLAGETGAAQTELKALVSKSKQADVVHLARVRLAQIMLDDNNPAGVIQLLSPIDSGSFSPLYDELLGDAYVILGETEKARQSYRKALLKPGKTNGLIQLKLNDLGAGGLAG